MLQVQTSNSDFDLPGRDPAGFIMLAVLIRDSFPCCPQTKVKININSLLCIGSTESLEQRSQVCISCPFWMNNENVNVKKRCADTDSRHSAGQGGQDPGPRYPSDLISVHLTSACPAHTLFHPCKHKTICSLHHP